MKIITHVKRDPANPSRITDLYQGLGTIPAREIATIKADPLGKTDFIVRHGLRTAAVTYAEQFDSWRAISDDGMDLLQLLPDADEIQLVPSQPRG